jgi:glycosyltransferase involved in cell wall biosynthesis
VAVAPETLAPDVTVEDAVGTHLGAGGLAQLRAIFDAGHYGRRAGRSFAGAEEALAHYLVQGHAEGLDPSPLFDTAFYLASRPEAAEAPSPLVHYLAADPVTAADPSPYFDSEYYCSQAPGLRSRRVNALAHYAKHGPAGNACNPNPLFGNGYYLAVTEGLAHGDNPFAHYVDVGWRVHRPASRVHQQMLAALGVLMRRALVRGGASRRAMLILLDGRNHPELGLALQDLLAREHDTDSVLVFAHRPSVPLDARTGVIVLQDFVGDAPVLRPAALALLARSLAGIDPLGGITDIPHVVRALATSGTPAHLLMPAASSKDAGDASTAEALAWADRVVFLARAPVGGSTWPARGRVAVRPYAPPAQAGAEVPSEAQAHARSLLHLAVRDFGLGSRTSRRAHNAGRPTRKVIVPCSNWSLSGVNTALEGVGEQLAARGWDVEILFTRDEQSVRASVGPDGLPRLPYRFLRRTSAGVEGMWEALIATLEAEAPCIVFSTYDFEANSVAPAVADDVGFVLWLQADDGDYYEQAYRLGRYCNALVCVSEQIRRNVADLHPRIGERAHVIHNTSVAARDVADELRHDDERISIVYTGRLIQYQKRILDFVHLADALERLGMPFRISLIGAFPPHDEAARLFPERAARHLGRGTIEVLGRLGRDDILRQLEANDFFVLLSDFEGLPLSLVEAMARGCLPIVAEMESGIPELVESGRNGLVMHGRDYDEWARVLDELWRDRTRLARLAERARETVAQRFTTERAAERFDELFGRIADEIARGAFRRPPALHWGEARSKTGDVLPPPTMYRPVKVAGLG